MQAALPGAAQVRQAVEKVYANPQLTPHRGFMDWVQDRLLDLLAWIGSLVGRLVGLRQVAPGLFYVVVVFLAVSALAILLHLLWTALDAAGMARLPRRRRAQAPAADTPRTPAGWDEIARRAAAQGRWREAALALYQALVLRLDARGAVRYDPAKTPGEYRREARAHPEAARTLAAFLRLFEPVAFGGREMDGEGWERLRAAAEGGARG